MPRYVKTPAEVTDGEVLSKHPYRPMWKNYGEILTLFATVQVCNWVQLLPDSTQFVKLKMALKEIDDEIEDTARLERQVFAEG